LREGRLRKIQIVDGRQVEVLQEEEEEDALEEEEASTNGQVNIFNK